MKKIATLLLLLSAFPVLGTHLIGGYIQVKRVSTSLTFEFTITIYMNEISGKPGADQNDFAIFCAGDGSGEQRIPRTARTQLDREISLNVYKTTHTYSGTGSGNYKASVNFTNWSLINNLTSALALPFYLETTFSAMTINNLPVFEGPLPSSLTVPINQKAVYNFRAKDADGDSVVHYLLRSQSGDCQVSSQPLPDYRFPNDMARKGTFKIDSKSGQLIWDVPTEVGSYGFTVVAEEWRQGVRISTTLFNMITYVKDLPGSTPGTVPPYEPVLERGLLTGLQDRVADRDLSVTVYPSPSESSFQVVLKSLKPTTAIFQLLDNQGRIIQEMAANILALEHTQTMGSKLLAPGLYLIRTLARGRVYTNKVIRK